MHPNARHRRSPEPGPSPKAKARTLALSLIPAFLIGSIGPALAAVPTTEPGTAEITASKEPETFVRAVETPLESFSGVSEASSRDRIEQAELVADETTAQSIEDDSAEALPENYHLEASSLSTELESTNGLVNHDQGSLDPLALMSSESESAEEQVYGDFSIISKSVVAGHASLTVEVSLNQNVTGLFSSGWGETDVINFPEGTSIHEIELSVGKFGFAGLSLLVDGEILGFTEITFDASDTWVNGPAVTCEDISELNPGYDNIQIEDFWVTIDEDEEWIIATHQDPGTPVRSGGGWTPVGGAADGSTNQLVRPFECDSQIEEPGEATVVTPVEPTYGEWVPDVTIPEIDGVEYQINGEAVSGTVVLTPGETTAVTAVATAGHVLAEGESSWEFSPQPALIPPSIENIQLFTDRDDFWFTWNAEGVGHHPLSGSRWEDEVWISIEALPGYALYTSVLEELGWDIGGGQTHWGTGIDAVRVYSADELGSIPFVPLTVTVDPAQITEGGQATFTVASAQAREEVTISIGETIVGTVLADADGNAALTITLPASAVAGTHPVTATGVLSDSTATITVVADDANNGGDGQAPGGDGEEPGTGGGETPGTEPGDRDGDDHQDGPGQSGTDDGNQGGAGGNQGTEDPRGDREAVVAPVPAPGLSATGLNAAGLIALTAALILAGGIISHRRHQVQ